MDPRKVCGKTERRSPLFECAKTEPSHEKSSVSHGLRGLAKQSTSRHFTEKVWNRSLVAKESGLRARSHTILFPRCKRVATGIPKDCAILASCCAPGCHGMMREKALGGPNVSETIQRLRNEIADLSVKLLSQINQRTERVLKIAEEKRRLGLPTRDPYRESQLLDMLTTHNKGPLSDASVRTLFRRIFDTSVDVQDDKVRGQLKVSALSGPKIKVAVQDQVFGGNEPQYIAGPCSVEDAEQMESVASGLKALGVRLLRGGTFKPRTSPYSFQGLGEVGLKLLSDTCRRHQMISITEATSPENVEVVARYADIIQIGARNMYNYDLLRAAGQTGKPILLKRGLSATLDEWMHAAEHITVAGSEQIILCERGIRTFAKETRGTLDLSIVPLAQKMSRLPVIVDVSHAAGRRDILSELACAAFAVGAEAVMIEVHPDPDLARSDSEQQINVADFAKLQREVIARMSRCVSTLPYSTEQTQTAALG